MSQAQGTADTEAVVSRDKGGLATVLWRWSAPTEPT